MPTMKKQKNRASRTPHKTRCVRAASCAYAARTGEFWGVWCVCQPQNLGRRPAGGNAPLRLAARLALAVQSVDPVPLPSRHLAIVTRSSSLSNLPALRTCLPETRSTDIARRFVGGRLPGVATGRTQDPAAEFQRRHIRCPAMNNRPRACRVHSQCLPQTPTPLPTPPPPLPSPRPRRLSGDLVPWGGAGEGRVGGAWAAPGRFQAWAGLQACQVGVMWHLWLLPRHLRLRSVSRSGLSEGRVV